jgi:hypothetical protein
MAERDHPVGGGTPVSNALESSVPALLELLADTEEKLVQARQALDDAERRAEQAAAKSGAFMQEIERTAADLVDAEGRAVEFHRQWIDASAREQAVRRELEELRSSRSWRITAPVRAVTGIRRSLPRVGGDS